MNSDSNRSHHWKPTKIRRVIETLPTGSEVVQVETDAGRAFAKFLGGKEGPHVLACELVGTRLAGLMGLPVLDAVLLHYPGVPEIVLSSGAKAQAGTAWLTRRVDGFPWGGHLANPADLTKLVLLDQWTRNCDRYRPENSDPHRPVPKRVNRNNVFFMREGAPEGRFILMAMDHTHILTCGSPLRTDLARIDLVRDITAFGIFPEFEPHMKQRSHAVTAVEAICAIPQEAIESVVAAIPADWQVDVPLRTALIDFLLQRRAWLAKEFVSRLFPQGELL
jgi:hypothetical protein